MSTALSRTLEESLRPPLVTGLDPSIDVRLYNAPPTPGKPLLIPAVVLHAKYLEQNLSIKDAGVFADDLEFRAECRVDATKPSSDRAAEALANQVKAAIATARPTGWKYLRLIPKPDEPTIESNVRVLTLVWLATVLLA